MVITETGAGTAVAKALPSLAGKLTSNAIRVPVPTISEETNSLFNEYLICSINSPSRAYFFMILFTSSTEVSLLTSKFITTKEQIGTGSGVIISEDGYIVTNNHVIKDATELEVTLNNNKSYKAKLIGTDSKMDIALLKINGPELE